MKQTLSLFAVLSLVACGGPDSPPPGPDAPAVPTIDYQPFFVGTHSLGHADGVYFQLSLTDTTGPIACGVAQDHRSALGTSGHQVIVALGPVSGVPCPTGTHSIRANCTTSLSEFQPNLPEDCAYYRRFNAQGQVIGMLAATAGAITVTGDATACMFDVNLSFYGEAYSETFTLTNGLVADPWCD